MHFSILINIYKFINMKDNIKKASEIISKTIDASVIDNAINSIEYTDEDIEKIKEENENLKSKQFELEYKLSESEKKYLYLLADLENIKRKYNKQIDDLRKYEGENILRDLLGIYDSLTVAMNNSDDNGYKFIRNNLFELLRKYDVNPIYNERPAYFNDKYDEAILSKDCDDPQLDNSINCVHQEGFLFNDKILRYEQVVVNKFKE